MIPYLCVVARYPREPQEAIHEVPFARDALLAGGELDLLDGVFELVQRLLDEEGVVGLRRPAVWLWALVGWHRVDQS